MSAALMVMSPDVKEFATMLSRSQLVPRGYANRDSDILIAMQYGHEVGLKPLQALQSIAVVNGKPTIYGDAALALVRSSGLCEYVYETIDEGDAKNIIAKCVVKRKGEPKEHVYTFSQSDAQRASLWGKSGPWSNHPKRMLTMRARGFALRSVFPDILMGLHLQEELIGETMIDVSQSDDFSKKTRAEKLIEHTKLKKESIEAKIEETPDVKNEPENTPEIIDAPTQETQESSAEELPSTVAVPVPEIPELETYKHYLNSMTLADIKEATDMLIGLPIGAKNQGAKALQIRKKELTG